MKWQKLGLIYTPQNKNEYLQTHSANPLAIHLNDNIYRVFYSGRDSKNRSSVGFVDVDIATQEIIKDYDQVFFPFGTNDSFYSEGVSIGNMFKRGEELLIPYMGWKIVNNNHWFGQIGGISLNQDLETIPEKSGNIFMQLDEKDNISLSYPWILKEENLYKMWYGSTLTWDAGNNEMIHVIKYATSLDGINWIKHGIAIPYEENVAQAFSRPTVIRHNDILHMWYSYRSGKGEKYRIGYASSDDGLKWNRQNSKSGINVSTDGWDSEMVCYPYVFSHKDSFYMLYNGNNYGKSGFGLAKLEI